MALKNLTGVIGWPIEHSLSPAMHNAAFQALEMDWLYLALPVQRDGLRDAVKGLKALGFSGINVTLPHKVAVIEHLDPRARRQMRDTWADVGRHAESPTEYERATPWAVAQANLQRVCQAFRCLEEYGKLWDTDFAREVEQLRYRSYELERAATLAATQRPPIARVRLYVLADGGDSPDDFQVRVEQRSEETLAFGPVSVAIIG